MLNTHKRSETFEYGWKLIGYGAFVLDLIISLAYLFKDQFDAAIYFLLFAWFLAWITLQP